MLLFAIIDLSWVRFIISHVGFFKGGQKKAPEALFLCLKMIKTVFGNKLKMDQTFFEGVRIPITWISLSKAVITQVKNPEKDGYWAVQVGFGKTSEKKLPKSLKERLKKIIKGEELPRFLREVRLNKPVEVKVGDSIDPFEIFKVGDEVEVSGVSKGKGFAGVVRRWKFAGGPKTHGQSDRQRAPGSIGQGTTPGRVYKGKKMAGRMGQETVTIKGLKVVMVEPEKGLIALSGPVPGKPGSWLRITKAKSGSLKECLPVSFSPFGFS